MQLVTKPLYLNSFHFRYLLENLGPSLGLWRAAEIAVLREVPFTHPILDLGCGDGFVMSMVTSQMEIGLDPDASALRHAEQRGIYTRFVTATAEQSGLPEGSAATIVSNSVLEHVPYIDSALQGAARLLRPGGELVITSPTAAFSRWLALPEGPYSRWRNRQLNHHNLWTIDQWADHLQSVGLEVTQVRPYLREGLVRLWDWLELLQQIYIGKRRLAGMVWRNLPPAILTSLARLASRTDLSAPLPGGGCLIRAVKA